MNRILLLIPALGLFSCISFPRAEMEARKRQEEKAAGYEVSTFGSAPAVKTRNNFQERYFR